jgi:hypothetical protein
MSAVRPTQLRWPSVTEPVEITFALGTTGKRRVLLATNRNGAVSYSLTNGQGGPPEALSNLQPPARPRRGEAPILFPAKAVLGWQGEVEAWAATCLWTVERVR